MGSTDGYRNITLIAAPSWECAISQRVSSDYVTQNHKDFARDVPPSAHGSTR